VSFNYLGQLGLAGSTLFTPATEDIGPLRSPGTPRTHRIEVNTSVVEGRLRASFTYSRNLYRAATVQRLARSFLDALRKLIEHCRSPHAGGFTPSDFTRVSLSQQELDHLEGLLDQVDLAEDGT
jgi:non-ribosomal peptide synthase protein (TIGR01720 family)